MAITEIVYAVAAMLFASLVAFTSTPIVRVLAYRIGAIDVPRDNRRMHSVAIPRLGGLAIYLAFASASLIFCDLTPTLAAVLIGGAMLVILGTVDDVLRLGPWIKLLVQLLAALLAVWQGVEITFINLFGHYIRLGAFSIPITILWIVGLTNAINLIDGLDGLSCGVSVICSFSLLLVMLSRTPTPSAAMLIALLAASCIGFLPYNINPAKIFMGDTGALFLGYTMAVLSIDGVFKVHAVLSFLIPIAIFAFPLFDTTFAFFRRIVHGKNPFMGDRGHIHHRLIDMGFNQRQSVGILYAVCGILGMSAVMFNYEKLWKAGVMILTGFVIFFVDFLIVKNPATRKQAGLHMRDSSAPFVPQDEVTEEPDDAASPENKAEAENTAPEDRGGGKTGA